MRFKLIIRLQIITTIHQSEIRVMYQEPIGSVSEVIV